MFNISHVHSYGVKDKDGGQEELLDIHIRGSSEKEAINVHNKKIMFFLHGDTLYEWTQMPQKYLLTNKKKNELNTVCKVQNKRIHHIDDSHFIFLVDNDGTHEIQLIKILNI